jgi:hypothetical protein
MTESTTTDAYAVPSTIIMECEESSQFRIIGDIPDWFARLSPSAASGDNGLKLDEEFPFLESFLVDAEGFWLEPDARWLRSESWSALDSSGNECQLEAMAVCLRNKKILMIECLNSFEPKQEQIN